MCARWGHVRQAGDCAPGEGMSATWAHVRQVGACAPGGGMCATLGRGGSTWKHFNYGAIYVPIRVHLNILFLVRSIYQSEYI